VHEVRPRMLRNLVLRIGALWRQLEHVAEERSILAVMRVSSSQDDLRVCAIQEGWRVLFATSVERAIHIRQTNRIDVVLYDCDVAEADWRQDLFTLLNCAEPVFAIAITPVVSAQKSLDVLDSGGYALTAKPLQRQSLVALVNGALQLVDAIDSCPVLEQV
jgi:DNA-binding response OmpR family regulator